MAGLIIGSLAPGDRVDAMSYLPCRGFEGEVPEQPVFVIKQSRAEALSAAALRVGEESPLAYRTERIDRSYVRLIIEARDGDVFKLDDQTRCSPGTLKATRARIAPAERVFRPSLRGVWPSDEVGPAIEASWLETTIPSETRVDWAYSVEEMRRGLHRTDITENWLEDGEASLRFHPDLSSELVVVRLTRYWPDGTSDGWKGWAHLDASGRLQVNEGWPTPRQAARFRANHPCQPTAPRTVPINPNFHHYGDWDGVGWQATGFAETLDGVALPLQPANDSTITVGASEGQVFRFDRIPRPSCPVPLRASSERAMDPGPHVADLEVSRFEEPPRGWILDLELESRLWPLIEVRWSPSRAQLPHSSAVERLSPESISFTNMHWESPVNMPEDIERFYVQLTPTWQDGERGPAWVGVVRIDPESGRASIEAESRLPLASEPRDPAAARRAARRPAASRDEVAPAACNTGCSSWGDGLVLGLLGWLVISFLLRRKPPAATTNEL
jgi:hypothetical protein